MKKLGVVILLLILCVAIVGVYRGWVTFSSSRVPQSNKVDISLTVDPDKVKEDAEAVKEKAGELADKVIEPNEHSGEPQEPEQKSQ